MTTSSKNCNPKRNLTLLLLCLLIGYGVEAQSIAVNVDHPGAAIRPTMWGIFFEDINLAADGGLYAELIKNRSFEFTSPLMGWKEVTSKPGTGTLLVLNRSAESPDNPRFLRVTHYGDAAYGLANEGFRGMGIKAGEVYHFSVFDRTPSGPATALRLELQDAKIGR